MHAFSDGDDYSAVLAKDKQIEGTVRTSIADGVDYSAVLAKIT